MAVIAVAILSSHAAGVSANGVAPCSTDGVTLLSRFAPAMQAVSRVAS
jgi:hypothetical protein